MAKSFGDSDKTGRRQRLAARKPPRADAKDRPGFDLDGAVSDATAGTGLGLGQDAAESRADRRLPGRKPRNKLSKFRLARSSKRAE